MQIDVNVDIIATEGDNIVYHEKGHNMVLNIGLTNICEIMKTPIYINRMQFNDGSAPVSPGDTTVPGSIASGDGTFTIYDSTTIGNTITFITAIPVGSLVGSTIRTVGLIDTNGNLIARYQLQTPLIKTNQKAVQSTWQLTFNRG